MRNITWKCAKDFDDNEHLKTLVDCLAGLENLNSLRINAAWLTEATSDGPLVNSQHVELIMGTTALPSFVRRLNRNVLVGLHISAVRARQYVPLPSILAPFLSVNLPKSSCLKCLTVQIANGWSTILTGLLRRLARNHPNLRRIVIVRFGQFSPICGWNITDSDIADVAARLPKLQQLWLPIAPNTSKLSPMAMISLGQHCRDLRTLHLGGSPELSTAFASNVLRDSNQACLFPELTELGIHLSKKRPRHFDSSDGLIDHILALIKTHFPHLDRVHRHTGKPNCPLLYDNKMLDLDWKDNSLEYRQQLLKFFDPSYRPIKGRVRTASGAVAVRRSSRLSLQAINI